MDSEVGREASRIRIGIKVLEVGTDRWAVRSLIGIPKYASKPFCSGKNAR